jgi:hypothetical protein
MSKLHQRKWCSFERRVQRCSLTTGGREKSPSNSSSIKFKSKFAIINPSQSESIRVNLSQSVSAYPSRSIRVGHLRQPVHLPVQLPVPAATVFRRRLISAWPCRRRRPLGPRLVVAGARFAGVGHRLAPPAPTAAGGAPGRGHAPLPAAAVLALPLLGKDDQRRPCWVITLPGSRSGGTWNRLRPLQ